MNGNTNGEEGPAPSPEQAPGPGEGEPAEASRALPLASGWDLLPVAWLALVLYAFRLVAMEPLQPTARPIPGLDALDPLATPFLALLLAVGIIRYFGKGAAKLPSSSMRSRSGPDEAEASL